MKNAKTFILKNKKTFRRVVKLFLKDPQGEMTVRTVMFSTEHLVSKEQRATSARQVPAQYSTSNQTLINALLSDTGYGITFYMKGDEAGKLKKASTLHTPDDFEKMALSNLFKDAGMKFDSNKPIGVLKQEYVLYMQNITGKKAESTVPITIPAEKVDVVQTLAEGVTKARADYKEQYGEEIPEAFKNDLALLDGISTPGFDAKKYIFAKLHPVKTPEEKAEAKESKEKLLEEYFVAFGKHVPNMKKNNISWIKGRLEEKVKN